MGCVVGTFLHWRQELIYVLIINAMAADVLEMQGARVSAAMAFI